VLDATATLGHLATVYPAATAVFLHHGLDFSCGGGQTLRDACWIARLDPAAVLASIAAPGAAPADDALRWDRRPMPELIEHILARYHEPLHRDFGAIVAVAHEVERVHRGARACPRGLAEHLEQVHVDLKLHLAKEEQMLFPMLLAGDRGHDVHMPVRVMVDEHDDHDASLRRIRELTSDFALQADAGGTWRGLYAALEQVEVDLIDHIHLENNVLFPRALEG
jgi:regulator of cell morphogenesis and NO signaling